MSDDIPLKEVAKMSWDEARAKGVLRKVWIMAINNRKDKSALKRVTHALKSIVKTEILRKDRTTDAEYQKRLAICTVCEHSVKKNGVAFSCGKLLENSTTTCGCVLARKARDTKESCPQKLWPTIKRT